jgi:phosphate transport system substrate-binding protein
MALAGPGLATPRGGVTLNGAGSSFDNPLFTSAFYTYHQSHPGVTINYAAVGSSAGIAQFQAGTVNFGATDVPMTHDQISQAQGPTLQVPVALGGVAIIYKLTGIGRGVRLTRSTLANIYLGTVTYWDANAIQSQNPSLNLPHTKITVVHRSDGSGTTYIVTDALSHFSSNWASGPGAATTVNWPTGVGATGSAGVAGLVAQTNGAIGYVELAYAKANHITFARIQNAKGNFISPGPSSVASAASDFPNVSATNFSIVNAPGDRSYPICGYSWMLVYKTQSDLDSGKALAQMANWLTHTGQTLGAPLGYVPLPAAIQALATKTIKKMRGPGGQVLLP